MPSKVFISYRRDDARYQARMIYEAFSRVLPREHVFMDMDSIAPGANFRKILKGWVDECEVLLALIGPNWLNATDPKTKDRRLDSPSDYVRIEIGEALARGIPVVPVLIDGAPLPDIDLLPDDLKELVDRQAEHLQFLTFEGDCERLIRKLRLTEQPAQTTPTNPVVASPPIAPVDARVVQGAVGRLQRWGWIAAAIAAGVLTIHYVGDNTFSIPVWWRGSSAVTEQSRAEQPASPEAEAKQRADEAAKAESDGRQAEAEAKHHADEEAAQRDPALSIKPGSGQSFRDRLADGQPCAMCPEMVVAPAGKFTMGSPPSEPGGDGGETQIPVEIAQPFAVGKFAVTFDQWDACVADRGCKGYRPNDQGWGRGNRPVINVNWADANVYAEWLSRKTGKSYRLLSEAEREYVTRAGTTTPFWWGSSITPKQANYNGNYTYGGGPNGEYRQRTVPVDSFEANPWGLFNVHGNVWEWTADCWNDSNQGNPGNGSPRTTGDCTQRVIRGGSWYYLPQLLRAAYRIRNTTDYRDSTLGFRLARTLNP
jgi:formylglycine-generating enzyme required for sulfatase activity